MIEVCLNGAVCGISLDREGRIEGIGSFPTSQRELLASIVQVRKVTCIIGESTVHSYYEGVIDGVECRGRTVQELCDNYTKEGN